MTTRKIIDIEHNGEKVWPKGHAKATFLSDGSTVEDVINNIQTGEGGITTETDPIFSASVAAKITNENITSWNNKVDKVDGKQLSTEDFTTLLKQKLEGLSNYDDTEISQAVSKLRTDLNTLVSGDTTTAIKTFNEVIAFLDGIQDTQDLSSIIASIEQQIAGKMDKVTLAPVATSGDYNDLSNKPTIPSAVTESTVSGWGFTKNTGTYSKPSGGIPKSDLASAVQTLLNKADTALQSYTEQYKGTVTSVKINGVTKIPDTNGMVDLGTIEGGGGSSSGGSGAYPVEIHDYGVVITAITPNVFHVFEEPSYIDFQFGDEIEGVVNEYVFQFSTGKGEVPVASFPDTIQWADGEPMITNEKTYQISIVNNIGLIVSV